MVRQSARNGFPVGNPIANLLVIVAGVLAIGASIVLGFFAFLAIGAVVMVAAAVIAVRVWWFNRKLRRQAPGDRSRERSRPPAGVIEGEYQVVDEDDGQT